MTMKLLLAGAAFAAFGLSAPLANAQAVAPAPGAPAQGPVQAPNPAAAVPGVVAASPTAPTSPAAPATPLVAKGDILETAQSSGQFTTFVKALAATNLSGVVKTTPNLTVFAPTDAAFAALPPGELDRLMKRENAGELQKILTYHLINAKVDSSKIKGAKGGVKTVEGSNVILDGSGSSLLVDSAGIVQADVIASNGVVHVIDKVLIPGAMPAAQAAAATDATASQAAAASAPAPAK
jgi:uncharacterized surface protein with fasciclin (FAS1) repeats